VPPGASNPRAFPDQLASPSLAAGILSFSFANFSTFHLLKTPPFYVHCYFSPILFVFTLILMRIEQK
jgi:Na+/H+ antiporter NhaC